ncbi:MAG: ABC transporter substrate-binding protein, partial [Pseudomonadota bacterium]
MKALLATTTLAALLIGAAASAQEKIELEVFHAWAGHQRFHKPIAEAFMEANPDVQIEFRAPGADYGAAHLSVLRGSLA